MLQQVRQPMVKFVSFVLSSWVELNIFVVLLSQIFKVNLFLNHRVVYVTNSAIPYFFKLVVQGRDPSAFDPHTLPVRLAIWKT